mmetsp:Transcript_38885/g.98448  ORF Transcript_38885/g.98448 Transcript_38885/m.98448 type:complete len:554 (-) Transcript_38885:368-2029(-)
MFRVAFARAALASSAASRAGAISSSSPTGGAVRPLISLNADPGRATRRVANAARDQADLLSLTVREIKELLDACNIDYRDCLEKRELVKRLEEHRKILPLHIKNHLASVMQRRGSDAPEPVFDSTMGRSALLQQEQNTISLFKRCAPSVVNITSMQNARLDRFSLDITQVPAGTGSGFVWDREGHIVTNFHVIQKASACSVTFSDNSTCQAKVVGLEPDKDLAVLRIIPPKDLSLSPVTVGSSQMLEVGQSVYAIGNPFGLDQTLTSGLVSGLGRQVQGVSGRPIRDVIQTDAAINPGNSGGPLLDSNGRLIGVNTMIYSTSGASAGIGFAVPSDTVRRVVNQLIRHGRVIRPSLGITILSEHVSQRSGRSGLLVMSVIPGTGAADAKLVGISKHPATGEIILGDEIVAVGGQKIHTYEDLLAAIEIFSVGDLVCPLPCRFHARGSCIATSRHFPLSTPYPSSKTQPTRSSRIAHETRTTMATSTLLADREAAPIKLRWLVLCRLTQVAPRTATANHCIREKLGIIRAVEAPSGMITGCHNMSNQPPAWGVVD